jgi:hypothetical protein
MCAQDIHPHESGCYIYFDDYSKFKICIYDPLWLMLSFLVLRFMMINLWHSLFSVSFDVVGVYNLITVFKHLIWNCLTMAQRQGVKNYHFRPQPPWTLKWLKSIENSQNFTRIFYFIRCDTTVRFGLTSK